MEKFLDIPKTEQNEQPAGNSQISGFTSEDTGFQSQKWFFTYHIKNGETFEQAFDRLENLKCLCDKYIWGEEYGKSGETPHIQGAFILSSKMRASTLQKDYFLNVAWLPKLKNWGNAFNYCQKECNRIDTNQEFVEEVITINEAQLRCWQRELITEIEAPPRKRRIVWVAGPQGLGKTEFQRYVCIKYGAILLEGTPTDMKNGVLDYTEKCNGRIPKIIMGNIPYDTKLRKVEYSGYETVKDMLFYSGKYKGGQIIGNQPHLILFSNGYPRTSNVKFNIVDLYLWQGVQSFRFRKLLKKLNEHLIPPN